MKNKKQKIESNANIFLSEYSKLMAAFLSKDINKVNSLKDELYKKAEMYKQEYKPWSDKIKAFNKQAEAYFAEDELVKKGRHSNPFIKEITKMFKALYAVVLTMLGFDLIYSIIGLSHCGLDFILVFAWIILLTGSTFNFWLELPLIFKRKTKWPKSIDTTKPIEILNLRDTYSNISMTAFLITSYSQLLEALSVLETDYPKAYEALSLKLKEIEVKGKFN